MREQNGLLLAEPGEIFGWFNWEAFSDKVVATAPEGSVLVELGVFLGKSLDYLARRAKASNKGLRVVGVDTFAGSPEFDGTVWHGGVPINETPPGTVLGLCYANLVGVLDTASLLVSDSARAAGFFADRSVHSVFIDAGHEEEDVRRDIEAWLPKVTGWIGGHDYGEPGFPGVKAAVDSIFGSRVVVTGSTWEVRVQ